MLRRIFRCLERPDTAGLSAQDEWREPPGHSTQFCYQLFGGHWGTWHHLYTSDKGPKEWVFKPFVDEQTMIGGKGRMIYKQHHMPQHAAIGSSWLCPNGSFKRVLSRGGAWENVNPGATHPDEKDHDDEQQQSERAETQPGVDSTEVPVGAGEPSPGDGDNGQVSGSGHVGEGTENPGVGAEDFPTGELSKSTSEPSSPPSAPSTEALVSEGEGVDGNGSPVV